jgi:hypothetical protein
VQTEELLRGIVHQAPVSAFLCVSLLKWRLSECHNVQENTQAENISFFATVIISFRDNFRRNVGRCAANTTQWHHQALGEAKIAQSDLVFLTDQNILKFDVSMAHLSHMSGLDSLKDLREETNHELRLFDQVTIVCNDVKEVRFAELTNDTLSVTVDLALASDLDCCIWQVLVLIDNVGAVLQLFNAVEFVKWSEVSLAGFLLKDLNSCSGSEKLCLVDFGLTTVTKRLAAEVKLMPIGDLLHLALKRVRKLCR